MEASTAPADGAGAAATTPPPATPTPDAAAPDAAAAAAPAAEVSAEGGELLLDAAIYEPPAERLRNYQQTALNKARQGNLVMCGASGIGKTHVALSLLREVDYSEGKLAFFLTTTRNLAEQQCARVRRATSLSAKLCVGIELDMWSKEKWQALFRRHCVIVCTAQVLVNLLDKGSEYMTMARINLLILDECHRAHRNHPYTKVMAHYDRADPATRPRVFGMTATPSKSCAAILHSPVHVCPMDEVKIFAAKAPLRVVQYEGDARMTMGPNDDALVAADGEGLLDEAPSDGSLALSLPRGGAGLWPQRGDDLLEELVGELHARLPTVAKAGNLDGEALRMSYDHVGAWFGLRHVQLVLEHWGSTTPFYDSELDMEEGLLAGKLALYLSKALTEAVARGSMRCSDRVQKLLACLAERRALDGDDFRAIVFVQRRVTCRVLYEYLNLLPGFRGATGFAIGQSTAAGVSAYGLSRRQRRPVHDFGAGRLQVLVATDVLSEGIDVPECSLVVAFDEVPNPTAFVQMRGRARQHDGGAFVLFAPDTDTLYKIFHLEVAASRFEQELLAEEEALLHLGDHSMSRLFPEYSYLIPSTGALINLDNAMPFLNQVCVWNRECQSYGLSPVAEMYEATCAETGEPRFRCRLALPAVFGIPPQETPDFRSKRVARTVAAFLACREFHRRGIVDDDLNPVRESVQLTTYDHFIPEFAGLQATNEKVPLRVQPDVHLGLVRLTREPPPEPEPEPESEAQPEQPAGGEEGAMAMVVAAAEEDVPTAPPATTEAAAATADETTATAAAIIAAEAPSRRAPPPAPPLEMALGAEATQEVYIYLLGKGGAESGGEQAQQRKREEEEQEQEHQEHQEHAHVLGVLTTVPLPGDALAVEGLPGQPAQTLRMTGAELELLARFQALLLHFVLHGPAAFQTELAAFLKVERVRPPASEKAEEGQQDKDAAAAAASVPAMKEWGEGEGPEQGGDGAAGDGASPAAAAAAAVVQEGKGEQQNDPSNGGSNRSSETDGATASPPPATGATTATDGDAVQEEKKGEEGGGENGEGNKAARPGKRKKRRKGKGKLALDEEQVEVFFHGAIEPHAGYDKGYILVPLDPATGAVDWPRVRALLAEPAPRQVEVGGGSLWPLPEEAKEGRELEGLVLTQATESSACRLWAVEGVAETTLGQARAAAAAARAAAPEVAAKEKEERERAEQEAAAAAAPKEGEETIEVALPDGDGPSSSDPPRGSDLKRPRELRSPPTPVPDAEAQPVAPPPKQQQQGQQPQRKKSRSSSPSEKNPGEGAPAVGAVGDGAQQQGEGNAPEQAGDGAEQQEKEKKEERKPEEPRIYLIEYPREVWDACDQDQPLLLVEKVLDSPHCFRTGAGSGLAAGVEGVEKDFRLKRQRSSNRRLIAPQVAALLPLPKHLYLACQRLLPRVWRLEIALAVHRVVERVGAPLRNKALVRAALCKPDYERLETIGDTYLKLVMGGVVLRKEPYLVRESLMHEFRANLICNRRLMQAARSRDLDGSIVLRKKVMNEPFRYWAPSLTRPGAASASVVQSKVVADVVEALTGAYLVAEGPAAADAFLHWLGLPVLCGPACRTLLRAEPSPVAAAAAAVLAAPLNLKPQPRPRGADGKQQQAPSRGSDNEDEDEEDGTAMDGVAAQPVEKEKEKVAAGDGGNSDSDSDSDTEGASTPEEDETPTPSILQPTISLPRAEEIHWPLQPKQCHCWTPEALVHTPQTIFPKPGPAPAADLAEKIGKLERLLRYTFSNKWLAFQALTHPSHTHKSRRSVLGGGHTVLVSDYQRFEFLGDALLDYMLIVAVAFEHPDWPPQRLHNAKQMAVNNEHLAQCALHWLQLHRFFESDSIELNHSVERFAQRSTEGADSPDADDEPEDAKRRGSGPKALADVLEALIAAVFIDCHGDVAHLAQVFLPFLRPKARRARQRLLQQGPGGGVGMGGLGIRQWKQRDLQAEGLTPEDEAQLHALFPTLPRVLETELGLGCLDVELLKAPVALAAIEDGDAKAEKKKDKKRADPVSAGSSSNGSIIDRDSSSDGEEAAAVAAMEE